ncbi:unnamed protein product [Amaranthus hypochondriacus]
MAFEAVVSVVIQKVTAVLNEDSMIFDKDIDQLEDIQRHLRGFLTDAEEHQKDDLQEYLKVIYNVEDMVESYVLTLPRKKKQMGILQIYGLVFHDNKAFQTIRSEMKRIEKKIKLLSNKPDFLRHEKIHEREVVQNSAEYTDDIREENEPDDKREKLNFSDSYKEDKSDFVGFKDEQENLERRLTEESSDRIISVVGPLGSGKSALVKRIYNRKSVSEKFVCHAWLDVSAELDFEDLLLRLWNQVHENGDNEHIVRESHEFLKLQIHVSEFCKADATDTFEIHMNKNSKPNNKIQGWRFIMILPHKF